MTRNVDSMDTPSVRFTLEGVRRGFVRGQALGLAAFAYGIAFGLLALEVGLSAIEAVLTSAVVYSGSAQLAAMNIMSDASPWTAANIWIICTSILIINARYFLYGATLRPWLGQTGPGAAYASLFVLADGNWILSMAAYNEGERDAGFVFGSGFAMFLAWITGTLAGSLIGALITNPALLGLDFLLVAFCMAYAVNMFQGRQDLAIVATAAVTALVTSFLVEGGWSVITAGLAGAAVAYLRHQWKARRL